MRRIEDRSRRIPGPLRPALEAGEARYRALIEAGADGVLVVGLEGVIGFANPAASALLGRHAEDLVGRPFGIPVVPGETVEVDIPRGDGTVRVAEMRAATTTWRGVPAYLAALRDITERKRAEEAAREAGATLHSFYDGAPMMMGVVELVGDDVLHVSSNAATARFFGVRQEDLDGQLASRLPIPPAILGLWVAHYRESERAGRPVRFEYAHETSAGPTWLSATVGYIGRTPVGRSQFSFVVEDVTERKRAEEARRDAERRKDEFLAMLAHELRNPLAAITNAVQLARRAGPGAATACAHEVIGRQSAHLARLIDDLLDVSRISRGKIRLRTQHLDAAPILRGAVEAVRPLIEQRGHALATSIPRGTLWVQADPTRLEQVVVNLLTNAAKYTDPGGRIDLVARGDGADVVIAVRDNGIGLAPEMLAKVFEPFAQVERSIDRSQGGLGIGLTLVRALAELHGGSASAASGGLGTGSEFVVRLPAAAGSILPAAEPPQSPRPAPARGRRILVVDDNRDSAGLTAQLLECSGHDVRMAHDGPSGLEAARAFRPEVVLLDIGLPGMDGYQVAESLRRDDATAGLRIIAVSGYGEEQARLRSRAAGCDHHLVKPVDIDDLLELVAPSGACPDEGDSGSFSG